MTDFVPTPRTTVHRLPKRGVYDRAAVAAILDEALVCHVGFATEGQPFVIPTIFARVERKHGFTGEVQLSVDGLPPGITADAPSPSWK